MSLRIALILIFFCLLNFQAKSQESEVDLTKEEKDSIIKNIGQYFEDFYVFPEQGAAIKKALNKKNKEAAFDTIVNPLIFRKTVQLAIRNVVDDKHIIFIYTGAKDDKNGDKHLKEPISDLKLEFDNRKGINFGIPEVKVLENNIGYLKITKFTSPELFEPIIRASSEYLKNVQGLILDLRSRGGGRSETVNLLLSYFLPPDTPILYWKDREGKVVERNWTLPYIDGYKFKDIPIVILTSSKTFSGSEVFCYVMKHHGMATLIGETTRGGAHTYKEMFPSEKYLILVPYQRVLSAKTNKNWEGIGVVPMIPASDEEALLKAKKKLTEMLNKDE